MVQRGGANRSVHQKPPEIAEYIHAGLEFELDGS